ncbi:DUF4167 domain-containing protein [Falsiroseomonas sp. CW058]|uniref:DUF4167 domain-containing protein n=1 Tax=Falsiroseomonas sp. CW058 TaxID=3388664 RepID=UPI003D31D12C
MNMKRMRGRGGHRHGGGGGGQYRQGGGGGGGGGGHQPMNRNHVFDSNGPDMRLRGTAQQLFEKYLQLGRDATGAGDRVMAESYFQHAEHYFRILNAMNQAQQQQGGGHPQQHRRYQNGPEQQDGGMEGMGMGMGDQPDMGGNGMANGHNGHALEPEGDGPDLRQPDPRDQG